MNKDIRVGDRVRLLGLPDWLIHDLPAGEQEEMRGFVGKDTTVDEIDPHGYFWISFSNKNIQTSLGCSGHSFAISREYIEIISTP